MAGLNRVYTRKKQQREKKVFACNFYSLLLLLLPVLSSVLLKTQIQERASEGGVSFKSVAFLRRHAVQSKN
jgi:hypothetical protein